MEYSWNPWKFMERIHEKSMEFLEIPMNRMGSWKSMERLMGIHENPWEVHGKFMGSSWKAYGKFMERPWEFMETIELMETDPG